MQTPDALARDIVNDWYRPGKSITEFHNTKKKVRALIGGRGSGKTTAIAVEASGHCFWNAGAKVYILRKTQDSNEDTTQETFDRQVFPNMGSAYKDTGYSLFKKIQGGICYRLPSRLAVERFNAWRQEHPGALKGDILRWIDAVGSRYCSFIYFAGVPSEGYRATRFRGYECSMLIFVEADQLQKEDLDMGVACLRWKGSDPSTCDEKGFIRDTCVILDTNPPSPRHWIAEMEREWRATNDPNMAFWHIPTRENRANLPDGYIESLERQYAKNPAMYQRMLLGEYAEAFDGKPVLFGFSQDHAFNRLDWPQGAYLVRGWDFGTTNAVVWSAYWSDGVDEYWWDLFEYFAEMSDVERQCRAVREITGEIFPFWNDRDFCSGIRDYCDPAGNQRTDKGRSLDVLSSYDVYPGYRRTTLQSSLAIYNRLLEKRDRYGKLVYRIDKESCPMLYVASMGGYRYPNKGEPGFGKDEPLKGPDGGNFDHIADASRYAKINCLRIIRQEVETALKAVGPIARVEAVNPARRYY